MTSQTPRPTPEARTSTTASHPEGCSRLEDYWAGRWVAGLGYVLNVPRGKVTRKKPEGHGDEVRRCTHAHRTVAQARACAEKWAAELNEQDR